MLTTAEKIKVIMKHNNFTMTELANQLNCSRQNLSNKMSRNNFDERELTAIANALGCELEINFVNRETGEKDLIITKNSDFSCIQKSTSKKRAFNLRQGMRIYLTLILLFLLRTSYQLFFELLVHFLQVFRLIWLMV